MGKTATSKLYFCVNMQAEPLVIDLKDLFQVIFNMRKKEAESSQKVMFQLHGSNVWSGQLCERIKCSGSAVL